MKKEINSIVDQMNRLGQKQTGTNPKEKTVAKSLKYYVDNFGGGAPSTAVWGHITGDIGNQTDLIHTVDDMIADELANFEHVAYKVADSVPTPTEVVIGGVTEPTQEGVRYLVKHPTENVYEEYILIDGVIHDIGSTEEMDLTNYLQKTDVVDNLTSTETQKPLSAKQGKELKTEIDELKEEVQFIFPKFWKNAYSGDCNLIKYKDKNILIDSYSIEQWADVKEMLDENDVEHIDYFILTHYHPDHYGNFKNLVNNNFIDSNTKLYMPAEVSLYPASIYTEYKDFCSQNNLVYYVPSENEKLIIDNLKITFHNCNPVILEELYTFDNDCSTVAMVEHKNVKAFYTGDAGFRVFTRLINENFINSKVNLYAQRHHGIDVGVNPNAIKILNPTFTTQSGGIKDFAKSEFAMCKETMLLNEIGTQYYPCYMQKEYIKFVSNGNALNCVQGKSYNNASSVNNDITLYVDINASFDDIQDGTQEHPFTEINQAIAYAKYFNYSKITINCADGHYSIYPTNVTNKKNLCSIETGKDITISINGNSSDRTKVIIESIRCIGSHLNLSNLTVYNNNATAIYIEDSNVYMENILITSATGNTSSNIGAHIRYGSNVEIKGSKIENCNYGVNVQLNSTCTLVDMVFGVNTTDAYKRYDAFLYTLGTISFANATAKQNFGLVKDFVAFPEQIMTSHSDFATTVSLTKPVTNYEWIEIYYKTSDGMVGSTGRLYKANGKTVGIYVPHASSGGDFYCKQCEVTISGSTLTIIKQWQTLLSGNNIVKGASGDYFDIQKVVAGKLDYFNIT